MRGGTLMNTLAYPNTRDVLSGVPRTTKEVGIDERHRGRLGTLCNGIMGWIVMTLSMGGCVVRFAVLR